MINFFNSKIITKKENYVCIKIKNEMNSISGIALTMGNTLRRLLLNNIMGTKITALELKDLDYNSFLINGLKEDLFEVLTNVKKVTLRAKNISKTKAFLNIKGPGIVTVSDIQFSKNIFVINPKQYLFTILNDNSININFDIEQGFGYKFNDETEKSKGSLNHKNFIDANFSPVIKVNYKTTIEESDTIKNKFVEALFLEIWTDGSITPLRAFAESCKIGSVLFSEFLTVHKKLCLQEYC